MKRRAFILGSAAAIGSIPILPRAQTKLPPVSVTCLVITKVSPAVSARKLLALLDVLTEKGIPFTCVVDPLDKAGRSMQPSHELSNLLLGYSLQGNSMELAPYVSDLSNKSEYFQGRAVRNANDALRRAIASHRGKAVPFATPKVVACEDNKGNGTPSGVRSTGVSTVLVLPKSDSVVSSEIWPNGTVRIYGGKQIDLETYSGAELHIGNDEPQRVFYVSAADLESLSVEAIASRATALANDLQKSEQGGRDSTQLISDVLIRDDYRFRRYLAVHLVEPQEGDLAAQAAFGAFQDELAENGIAASVGKHAGPSKPIQGMHYWLPVGGENQSGQPSSVGNELSSVVCNCVDASVKWPHEPTKALPPGHTLAFGDPGTVTRGFDACAVMWLPCLDVPDQAAATRVSSLLGHMNDTVISIRPNALTYQYARKALLNQLLSMASDGVTEIVPVQRFGQVVAPQGAEIERQRRTVAALPRIQGSRTSGTATNRQMLLEDARTAWAFFEHNTDPRTGLCSATYDSSAGGQGRLLNVTMWDVGSQINGLVAALQLGLVPKERFDRNIDQILHQIQGRKSQGRLLPQGWLRVERNRVGNRNFDGSDAGRLLSSLENLRRNTDLDDRLKALVGSWDLEDIVIDGEVHSVTAGELHSVYRSHSAHYAARAFRKWGISARSPYEVFGNQSTYDDQMALLEVASWIGPLGAEPLLLEAMELGMSPESTHLANVLFAAQLEDHDENGRLIAVSEGPLDHEPWFTYQGLQLDAAERTWALDTVGREQKYRTPEFWRDNLMISSKAAYLWAAYRPHDYSDKLVAFVRNNCRTRHGFASGTFNNSGRVTSTYTDLNTNGVILQAIAYMLSQA